jgi:hypothetical protein
MAYERQRGFFQFARHVSAAFMTSLAEMPASAALLLESTPGTATPLSPAPLDRKCRREPEA